MKYDSLVSSWAQYSTLNNEGRIALFNLTKDFYVEFKKEHYWCYQDDFKGNLKFGSTIRGPLLETIHQLIGNQTSALHRDSESANSPLRHALQAMAYEIHAVESTCEVYSGPSYGRSGINCDRLLNGAGLSFMQKLKKQYEDRLQREDTELRQLSPEVLVFLNKYNLDATNQAHIVFWQQQVVGPLGGARIYANSNKTVPHTALLCFHAIQQAKTKAFEERKPVTVDDLKSAIALAMSQAPESMAGRLINTSSFFSRLRSKAVTDLRNDLQPSKSPKL